MSAWRSILDEFVDEHFEAIRAARRYFHAHPEASREEYQTTQTIARMLHEADIPHRVVPSGRGLFAGFDSDGPGSDARRVALRADIDALRIQDDKEVQYRSTREGLMHACGHDAHTAILLGACWALAHLARRTRRPLPWRAIFQPAEEAGDGAAEMIGYGAMEGVDAILALHVDPERPLGSVGLKQGALTACCSEFHAVVHGRGGHAARPHQATEAIPAAAQFVSAVHTLVPRSVDSRDPVVVTFGVVTGGTLANVIPDRVILRGTLRTLAREISGGVEEQLREIARGVGTMTGTTIDLTFLRGPEAVVNDPAITDLLAAAASEVLGPGGVGRIERPSLGGEDFGAYLAHAPGSLMRLGVAAPNADGWPLLHSSRFDIDERALGLGVKILVRAAVQLASGADLHAPPGERGG